MLKQLLRMCQKKQKIKISIEGNIASGKSSIINYLQSICSGSSDFLSNGKRINLNVFTEPVNEWRNLNGTNLLELMYKDPSRWVLAFHSYVQLTMLDNHLKMNQKIEIKSNEYQLDMFLMERSLYSAKYCFLKNILNSNLIQPVEYELLSKWFHWMIESHDCSLDLIFYLKTRPETCFERIRQRARPEEVSSISLDYLKRLHELHESWLCQEETAAENKANTLLTSLYRPKHVIVIDANADFDEVCNKIETQTKMAASLAF